MEQDRDELQTPDTYRDETTKEKLWAAESHISMVRLFVLLFSSFIYHFIMDDFLKIPWLATAAMVLAFPFSFIMVFYKPYKKYPVLLSRLVTVTLDGLFIVIWIFATGGADSPFYMMWCLSIIAVAQRFSFKETLLVSMVYMVIYYLMVLADPFYDVEVAELVVRITFIPVIGILGAYFSREITDQINDRIRIRDSEKEIRKILQDLNQQMAQKNEAEYQLKQIQLQLEHKVEERTNDFRILNEQLKKILREKEKIQLDQEKTLQRLEHSNKELESFAYITSHDLKAPLRGIATITDWLTEDFAEKLDQEGNNNLKMLKQRVQKMNDLIEGILQYSRIDRAKVEATVVDPGGLLSDIIGLIHPQKNITFIISEQLPLVLINKTLLLQVFENLLSNAVKYMGPTENGKIIVDVVRKENECVFFVMDTGPGIHPRYHEKIFEMFQTLEAGKNKDNTGMGLAIVKKIIRSLGGRLWVESEPGKGSTFFFSLPMSYIYSEEKTRRPGVDSNFDDQLKWKK